MQASLRLALAVVLVFLVLPIPSVAAQGETTRTFRDLGYGDLTARTMYGGLSYFFPVPHGHLVPEGSQLKIVFSHSSLLMSDRSTMTVVVNGQSLSSTFLTPENVNRAQLTVSLPAQGAAVKGLFVQVLFWLRLTRDECEETQNPALWATVHGDSALTLVTRLSDKGPGLEDLDGLFAPPTSAPVVVTLVQPPEPRPEDLEAAGLVAFQVGRWAAAVGQDAIVETARAPLPNRPAILVGSGSSLPALSPPASVRWDGRQFVAPGGNVPGEHGVLALARGDSPRLLVSGATPAAVRAAAEALVRPERLALLAGDHAILTGVAPVPLSSAPWREGAASFAQLGVERPQLAGPGEHVAYFNFERPAGWMLRDGGALELAIETSAALRSETSWVSVAVNGVEVGTQRLQSSLSGERRYRFELPADPLNTDLAGQPLRRLSLQIRFYLDLPHVGCTQVAPASAWAALLPTSAWLLPHRQFTGLDLGRFPAPLLGPAGAAPLSIVLPEKPDSADLTAGLQVMAALGRWTAEEVAVLPRLTTTASLTDAERQQNHLVLVGGPSRNTLTATAADAKAGLFEAIVPAFYRLVAGERRGGLHLVSSPWGRDRALLLLSEDTPEGLRAVAGVLARGELLAQVRGRTAAVVEGLPPQSLTAAEPASTAPPTLAPRVEVPLVQRIPAWQVVGAVLFVALVAMLAIVVVVRWLRRSSD